MLDKLPRRRRSVFAKRELPKGLKVFGVLVLCAAVVAAGFFTAKFVTERQKVTDAVVQDGVSTPNKPSFHRPNNDAQGNHTPDGNTPAADSLSSLNDMRAFYLTHAALLQEDLTTTLHTARKAGFNAVLFDLKDADGNLYYRFEAPQAKTVNSYTADAFTADGLSALFAQIRACGLQPIPRLYAFRDDAACVKLTDARICHVDNHSWAWYDGKKENGAKKWLNPYSNVAQNYVQSLAQELKAAGAAAVMLDGVQFPDKLTSSAYLGDTAATIGKDDLLSAFVATTRTMLGADCPLLLGCTANNDVTNAKLYGGNPLTFGPTIASPLLSSKVQESVEKMVLRTQVLEESKKPLLTPMLPISNLTATKVNDTLSACIQGGANGFILYHPDGKYDFAAYNLP